MTKDQARVAMASLLQGAVPGYLISWYNDLKATPPSGTHLHFSMEEFDTSAYAWSGRSVVYRNAGRAVVQIYAPTGIGSQTENNIANTIRHAMQGVVDGDLRLYGVQIRNQGINDSGWSVTACFIAYEYDEVITR